MYTHYKCNLILLYKLDTFWGAIRTVIHAVLSALSNVYTKKTPGWAAQCTCFMSPLSGRHIRFL